MYAVDNCEFRKKNCLKQKIKKKVQLRFILSLLDNYFVF